MSAATAPLAPAKPQAGRDLSSLVTRDAVGDHADFAVEGMHCASCMSRIEKALSDVTDIVSARVNLAEKRVTVNWRPGMADPDRVIGLLASIGYKSYPLSIAKRDSVEAKEMRRLIRALGVAGFAMMNIMLLSVSVWSGAETGLAPETRTMFHWVSALIALPTAAYSGMPFFESAIRSLKARAVNMDVPISLGILLALGLSVVETLNHGEHAYFDGAVMLIFFLLLGRTLDQMMRKKTRDVAANVAALRAVTAMKIFGLDSMREVPVEALAPGDLVLVRPGDRVAIDGVVEKGESRIDQSLVTGETRLAKVAVGDMVYAGTLNHGGALQVRASAAAKGSLLADIERLLDNASQSRARYVKLADRAARLYAPMVHLTAFLTFAGWVLAGLAWQKALVIAITVLIITCPCALGLAIPVAQVVASGTLFRRNVLISTGDALERLAGVDTVVFDKTGTLTTPDASVLNLAAIPAEVLVSAGRLALSSHHPLAKALALASGASMPFESVREEPGKGLVVAVNGLEFRLGSLEFCGAEAQGSDLRQTYPDASQIAVRIGDKAHVFAIGQSLRPDAKATIDRLKAAGLRVEILSGDHAAAVERAGAALQVEALHAGAKPGGKVAVIEAMRAAGRKVLMIGDGINDAPALAAANVSMSPVSGAELTQAAADTLFLGDRLEPVADSILVSRKANGVMMQNLWLAVIYNAIAVPIAIAGYATPLVAAIAMSGSSIIVTLNALRLRHIAKVGT
jgi:P-type Cu2+ transporter